MFPRQPPLILIGAHHKAGTHWLTGIFRHIAAQHNLQLLEGEQPDTLSGCDIFFQDHSAFKLSKLKRYRGLHMIRDPRDIIVSGCFYHQRAEEEWLHLPRRRYEGMSYVGKINSFTSQQEQLLFEMEHIGVLTLKDMLAWNYRNRNFLEIKYENLIGDLELEGFREAFKFLQKGGTALSTIPLEELVSHAHDNSLLSGKVDDGGHVRSGEASQWRDYFDDALSQRFLELFGDILIQLGYEKDHSWANFTGDAPGRLQCESLSIFDVLYHPEDVEYQKEVTAGRIL